MDAIESGSPVRHKDELGDLLLQVVLQSQIRKEKRQFAFDDVAGTLADKLVRRHPHVFGHVKVRDADDVLRNWEKIKACEKKDGRSILEGIPRHLPALQRAQRAQSRASRVGFDWTDVKNVLAKVDEELAEVREAMTGRNRRRVREEIGDLLFAVVNFSRFLDIPAEEALRATVAKFTRRFQQIERRVRRQGKELKDCSPAEMDAHWEDIKKRERVRRLSRSKAGASSVDL
jgi:tetrapyrrole methylase family protein/MazG family protein